MKDWKQYEERAKRLRKIIEDNTRNGALIKDLQMGMQKLATVIQGMIY